MMIQLHPFAFKYISSNGLLRTLIYSRSLKLISAPYTTDDMISDTGYVKPSKKEIQIVRLYNKKIRKTELKTGFGVQGFFIIGNVDVGNDSVIEDYGLDPNEEYIAEKVISVVRKREGDKMLLSSMATLTEGLLDMMGVPD